MAIAYRTLLATLTLAALQILVYWIRLPDVVASHFDGAGVPNGWASKTTFFAIYIAMLIIVYVSFVTLPRWQHARMQRRDIDAWRLQIQLQLQPRLVWLGAAHVVFMIVTVQLVIHANLSQRPLSAMMYWLLGGYFAFLTIWLVSWFASVRAARPPG